MVSNRKLKETIKLFFRKYALAALIIIIIPTALCWHFFPLTTIERCTSWDIIGANQKFPEISPLEISPLEYKYDSELFKMLGINLINITKYKYCLVDDNSELTYTFIDGTKKIFPPESYELTVHGKQFRMVSKKQSNFPTKYLSDY